MKVDDNDGGVLRPKLIYECINVICDANIYVMYVMQAGMCLLYVMQASHITYMLASLMQAYVMYVIYVMQAYYT